MVDVRGHTPVRVLLLGMRCASTVPVAEALLGDPNIDVAAAVVPGERSDCVPPSPYIPLSPTTAGAPLDQTLRQNHIPLVETPSLRRRDLAPVLARLELPPLDAIVVACFPWRVPRWLRELPRFGALNVHPSLLPALRGPEPEFWALRLGLRETGVTIHIMDEGFDTGAVLAQRALPVPPDVTLPALERSLAMAGGALAVETLRALARGEAEPRPQTGEASYAPSPGAYDLAVPTDLPAAWAARFVRAVAPVHAPLTVLVMATGQRLLVDGVVDTDERGTLAAPAVEDSDAVVAVRFSPGVVRFHQLGAGDVTDRRGRS